MMIRKLGLLLLGVSLNQSVSASFAELLKRQIQASLEANAAGQKSNFSAPILLDKFYESRSFEPAWLDPEGPIPEVNDLLIALRQADREGLTPSDYQLSLIQDMLDAFQVARSSLTDERLAALELLLSDAFLTYGSDLVSGRTNPYDVDDDWFAGRRTGDLPGKLEQAIQSREVREALNELLPAHPMYKRMRMVLARYRLMEKNGEWPLIEEGKAIKAGSRDPRLPSVRARLILEGYLNQKPNEKTFFDYAVAGGLKKFQSHNGLFPDGVLGKDTIKLLNIPASHRVQEIKLNMERCRWLPDNLGRRYIFVNVPSFTLQIFEDQEVVLKMKVVVGRKLRQTPVFSSTMTHLVLNPSWSVPVAVARLDILDHIREEPDYLTKNLFEVFDGYGSGAKLVDPAIIDWTTVTPQNLQYKFRQKTGPLNALGQIKFLFPNKFDVYLHDTSSRSLFSKTMRDFSSGCIRVEKPVELAAYLLQGDPSWGKEKIEGAINKKTEQTIWLSKSIPVHLMYWTAWVDESDEVQFREDIYGRDDALAQAIDRGPEL